MALGQAITFDQIKAALSESTDDLFLLCTSNAINKWSRFKPVRDSQAYWPAGDEGHFGFNIDGSNPDKWDYNRPRGNAVEPNEPAWDFHFAGYEHNKALTDPPVYADYTTAEGDLAPTVDIHNTIPWNAVWRFGKNTVHGNVRILPGDIGIGSYCWGVRLLSPSGPSQYYYKTLGSLNDDALFTINVYFTDPESIEFTNFPPNAAIGTWYWQLFISSTEAADWTTSAPSDIIYLPTDADISRLISSGSFNLLAYIVFGGGDPYEAITDLPTSGNYPNTATSKISGYEEGTVNTNSAGTFSVSRNGHTWFHFAVYNGGTKVGDDDDASDVTYVDGRQIRVWCDLNTGGYRTGNMTLTVSDGGSYTISINQDAGPAILHIQSASGWGVTLNDYGFTGTNLWVQFTVTGMPSSPQTVTWGVTRGGVNKGSGTIDVVANGVMRTVNLTLTESAVGGANYYLDINDGS